MFRHIRDSRFGQRTQQSARFESGLLLRHVLARIAQHSLDVRHCGRTHIRQLPSRFSSHLGVLAVEVVEPVAVHHLVRLRCQRSHPARLVVPQPGAGDDECRKDEYGGEA